MPQIKAVLKARGVQPGTSMVYQIKCLVSMCVIYLCMFVQALQKSVLLLYISVRLYLKKGLLFFYSLKNIIRCDCNLKACLGVLKYPPDALCAKTSPSTAP